MTNYSSFSLPLHSLLSVITSKFFLRQVLDLPLFLRPEGLHFQDVFIDGWTDEKISRQTDRETE